MKKQTKKTEEVIPKSLMNELDKNFNPMETVTVTYYNPHDKGNYVNQLTITTEIMSGLTEDERRIAINAAIQKNRLLMWKEI